MCPRLFVYASNSFTFHYVSIKSTEHYAYNAEHHHLHSTMYLLNQQLLYAQVYKHRHLHSTMYLLNRANYGLYEPSNLFTFHYVSIKSRLHRTRRASHRHLHSTMYLLNLEPYLYLTFVLRYLHSTMYLLNQIGATITAIDTCLFTFHYVSIKSQTISPQIINQANLHSTMYLLNHVVRENNQTYRLFTFHYVSIKSKHLRD